MPTAKRAYKQHQDRRFYAVPFMRDDLHFDHQNTDQDYKDGISDVIDQMKLNPNAGMSIKGSTVVLYQMGFKDIKDQEAVKIVESHIYKWKEQYSPRLAFGGLYGSLKTDLGSPYTIGFFEEEIIRNLDKTTILEAMNLVHAYGCNTNRSNQAKNEFIQKHLKEIIIKDWKKVANHITMIINVKNSMIKLQNWDKEIWEGILTTFKKKKQLNRIDRLVEVYESLYELQQSKQFFRDLQPELDILVAKLNSREDFQWRYNIEERKFYKYSELVATRDNLSEKQLGQTVSMWRNTHQEDIAAFLDWKQNVNKLQADEEIKYKEKELEDLIKEKFGLKTSGEMDDDEDDKLIEKQDFEYRDFEQESDDEMTMEEKMKIEQDIQTEYKNLVKKDKEGGSESSDSEGSSDDE